MKNPFLYIAGVVALLLLMPKKIKAATTKKIASNLPKNLEAFLYMIQYSEGTVKYKNPYNVLFGGTTFNDYSKHPNKIIHSGKYYSSAAGAYQILKKTADSLKMKDFTPISQDKAAIQLIKEKNALNDVLTGNFKTAVNKVKTVWASLPGAGYGQPERKINDLAAIYKLNGGEII